MFDSYLDESILHRAQKKRLVRIAVHDVRKWANNRHKTADDRPFGGGAGMVMKIEPIFRAVAALKKTQSSKSKIQTRVVLFSASGKQFNQRQAERYAKRERIVLICGRYEGVDERVAKYIADEELSIGPYVLTGGELPAMVVIDAVMRLIPGVLGNPESLKEESFSKIWRPAPEVASGDHGTGQPRTVIAKQSLVRGEYPQYTRPAIFYPGPRDEKKAWRVPKVLLSGDHQKIAAWREKHQRIVRS